jgi:hypothetical protein
MNQESVRGNDYKGILQIGQWVHSILYGGRDGIICKITGDQKPETIQRLGGGICVMGGSATLDVVFDNHVSRGVPEGIIRGVQWYISEEFATSEEIMEALAHAEKAVAEKKEKERQAAEAKAKEKAALPAKYPYLTPIAAAPGKSSHALGAKNLKIELEHTFPGIKFSVKSESYSGGDSIRLGWTDGPLQEEVKKVSGKYQEGHFNGMEDIYNYNDSPFPDVFGGAKYVMESRHESAELTKAAGMALGFNLSDFDNFGNIAKSSNLTTEQEMMIYREARKTPGKMPEKATDQRRTEETPTVTTTARKGTKAIIAAILA